MRVNAVIVAAGKGERMGAAVPKAFLDLSGVPLFIRTLHHLLRSPLITTVVVVVAAEYEALCQELLASHGPFQVPLRVVHGGAERQDSVRLGLTALDADCEIVVIHDAARPFIAANRIDRSITVAAEHGAAVVAIPVRDTIKRVDGEDTVSETVSREHLWLAQTPQTFRVPVIREAHARAFSERVRATDDAALVEWLGGTVKVVLGDSLNFKLTTPEDWQVAEAILHWQEAAGQEKTDGELC